MHLSDIAKPHDWRKNIAMSDTTPMTSAARKINWGNTLFLTLLPFAAFMSLGFYLYYNGFYWGDILIALVLYSFIGLGVTAGYHRCFSHRAFECSNIAQFFFLVFGAAALENSALSWSSDHRIHHRHVDSDEDPYNIKKGFFWAHMGWVFFDQRGSGRTYENVPDLKKNKLVMWQHNHYLTIAIFTGFVLPTLLGWALFKRPLGGFIWGGLVRSFFIHHSTFLINSAAHVFGKRPYSISNTARDSWWLAFFTFGEGYHNFHHAFPSDYRNGLRWWQWDPTKWLIGAMSWTKLSWDLRRTPKEKIQHSMELARAKIQDMQDSVQDSISTLNGGKHA